MVVTGPPHGTGGIFAGSLFVLESAVIDRDRADDDRATLRSRNALAAGYVESERIAEALALFETVLADARRLLGPTDPDTLVVEGNLAATYLMAEQDNTGIELMRRNVELRVRVLGRDHPATLVAAEALAAAYRLVGRVLEPAQQSVDGQVPASRATAGARVPANISGTST